MISEGELGEALSRLIDGKINGAFTGKVISIDDADSKGIVKVLFDELTYDVKLKSIIDSKTQHLLLIPKMGSTVFCIPEGNSQERYLAVAVNELERVELNIGDISMLINDSGITLNGGSNGGLAIVSTLYENLSQLKKYLEAVHLAIPAALNAIGVGTAANGQTAAANYTANMKGKSITISDFENNKVKH